MINHEDELRHYGLRITQARLAILGILKSKRSPITLEALRESLADIPLEVNLSTIYRILEQFEDVDLLVKSTPKHPFLPVYEYRRSEHSHHLICTQCRKITVIEGCPIHAYEEKIAQQMGYLINSHQLELYGICPKCQERMQG